jgi:predicted porin
MMTKKLVAAAALLALAGGANAQMVIYGLMDVSYGQGLLDNISANGQKYYLDCATGLNTGEKDANFHSGGDNCSSEGNSTTRIGFKGSYDVAPDIKAKFQLETGGIQSDGKVNNDGTFFNRQAWFGFASKYGEMRFGKQDSVPYQVMNGFDFNGASNGVSALSYTGVAPYAPGRQSRSLQYISPGFSGFTVQAGLQLKDTTVSATAKDVFALAGRFDQGPISVGASYQSKADANGKDFSSIAGSFDFKVVKVMASYTQGGKIADGGTGSGYGLGITAPVAGFNIGAIYGTNDDDLANIKAYELFVNKEIFKNTYAYGEYGDWKGDLAAFGGAPTIDTKAKGFAIGVIYVF